MIDIRAKILWWGVNTRIFIDKPKIIAITGSLAKTSTKDATYEMLRHTYPGKVRASFGNLNSYLGVPLGILGFKLDFHKNRITFLWGWILILTVLKTIFTRLPKYIIIELGVDKPGDMDKFLEHLKPFIAVITLIDKAHLMNFESEKHYAEEKIKITKGVKSDGFVIANSNDQYKKEITDSSKVGVTWVETATENISEEFAKVIGKKLDLTEEQIQSGLAEWERPAHRFNKIVAADITIYDDTYNANPASMQAALSILENESGRKVAILGEMKELGMDEERLHKEIGDAAHKAADIVIGVGQLAELYKPKILFTDSRLACEGIFNHIQKDDIILVKGSHSLHMEYIVDKLKERTNVIHGTT